MSFTLPDLDLAEPEKDAALPGPLDDLAAGFGATLAQLHVSLGGKEDDAARIARAGAAISRAVSDGHACLPLEVLLKADADTLNALVASPVVLCDPERQRGAPREVLIVDRRRLYLQRYWRYETRLATLVAELDEAMPVAADDVIDGALNQVFDASVAASDLQRAAAAGALRRRLTVVTGSPGTGKTRTVARLLLALVSIAPTAKIALAAPTGKAALRLEQSVKEQIEAHGIGRGERALADLKATTVHSLLGARYGGVSFRHDRERPLIYDVVVIDEASMLDLALATKLLEALPPHARLVLLGDADQLASVETGAVFAELSSLGGRHPARLDKAVVELKVSYRYQSAGAIGRFADAVRQGEVSIAMGHLLTHCDVLALNAADVAASLLIETLLSGFGTFITALEDGLLPHAVLKVFERYRVLTALRHGPLGSIFINAALERAMGRRLGVLEGVTWFPGRPVIVTQNDPLLKLFNGDIGIALSNEAGQLLVYFEDGAGVRAIAPGRLPNCETALALTIHKSQGSEFERIDVILPPEESPLAARELVYTAVTRARQSVRLWGSESALAHAIATPTVRYSALAERLCEDA